MHLKINIHRVIMCLTCLVTCFILVVAGMVTPAKALTYLNPDDYLHDVVSDGTNKIARYDFSSLYCYIHTWDDATNVHADARWEIKYEVPRNAWTVLMDVFPLGGYQESTALDWRSVALDVSDILPGSPLPISCRFHYEYKCATLTGDSATLHYSLGVYYFDANGNYVGTVGGETGSRDINAYTEDGFSELIEINGTFPADAHYVVPFLTLRTVFDDNEHDAYIYVRSEQFALDVTIDTVIENSNMMQSINNKLDAVGDKLDHTNDKLDDVISGGEAGDKLDNATGKLDNKNEELSGTMEDYDNAFNKLPTTPNADHFENIVDQQGIDDAIDEANKVFDWDASGLTYMFPPMAISLSLAVLFYVVFGKG